MTTRSSKRAAVQKAREERKREREEEEKKKKQKKKHKTSKSDVSTSSDEDDSSHHCSSKGSDSDYIQILEVEKEVLRKSSVRTLSLVCHLTVTKNESVNCRMLTTTIEGEKNNFFKYGIPAEYILQTMEDCFYKEEMVGDDFPWLWSLWILNTNPSLIAAGAEDQPVFREVRKRDGAWALTHIPVLFPQPKSKSKAVTAKARKARNASAWMVELYHSSASTAAYECRMRIWVEETSQHCPAGAGEWLGDCVVGGSFGAGPKTKRRRLNKAKDPLRRLRQKQSYFFQHIFILFLLCVSFI